jgi:hypothetical protein
MSGRVSGILVGLPFFHTNDFSTFLRSTQWPEITLTNQKRIHSTEDAGVLALSRGNTHPRPAARPQRNEEVEDHRMSTAHVAFW